MQPSNQTPDPRRRIDVWCGALAVLGGVVNAVSDLMLRSGPVSGAEINHGYMATMPYPQVLTGALLGAVLGIPLWFASLVPLQTLLRPVGKVRCFFTLALLGYLFLVTSIYHGVYAFYASTHQLVEGKGSLVGSGLDTLLAQNQSFESALGMVWFAAALGSSMVLASCVLSKKCKLGWGAVFCLPVVSIFASLASQSLPAPIGGYLRPMAGSLVFTALFVVVTLRRAK